MRGMRKFLAPRTRRGTVVVQFALTSTVVLGFAALSVDIGKIYVAQSELQRSADSAALAAATMLSDSLNPNMESEAGAMADAAAQLNSVLGTHAGLDVSGDVVFGHAQYDAGSGRYEFQPNVTPYDAVEVTVRRAEGSAGGPVDFSFASIFGVEKRDMHAKATALLVPRDISVVIDLSNSMNWDSQLRYWNRSDGGNANTRDVWAALDGPEPSRPYLPGPENATEYAADSGPTIGVMSNWGNALVPGSYSATADPGLWYVRKSAAISGSSSSAINASLTSRGYIASEISALTSASNDSNASHWRNRAGVILGLASWKSGKSGGTPGGDGDNLVESTEVTWIAYPSFRTSTWTWTNYIDWVQSNTIYNGSNPEFRYRYGLKTFTDFLLESHPENSRTNILWATPQQPLRAVKDAVQTMIDEISAQDSLDHAALEIFATSARHEVDLSVGLQNVADTLYERQSGHYDRATNIGDGLKKGIDELKSERARPNATKVIVIMSDGTPNIDEFGNSVGDGASAATSWAYAQAQRAADENIQVVCVAAGYAADFAVMSEIANIANGVAYQVQGPPEEYTQELRALFQNIAGKRKATLIK